MPCSTWNKLVADSDTIREAIVENATGPASASNDSGSMSQHDLEKQIAAAKYAASTDALANNPRKGIRLTKLIPGGAV